MTDTGLPGMIALDDAFYERVYREAFKIPRGKVSTYGKIAELAGYPNAAREVGLAMSRARAGDALPYHRVVSRGGTLAPDYAFGGRERQRNLLLAEGVTFLPNGAVDMERHMWPQEEPAQLSLF